MAEHRDGFEFLQHQLELVNREYRLLVRSTDDKTRLPKMSDLRRRRLDLISRIINLERFRRLAS
jgi:hypothetical protein